MCDPYAKLEMQRDIEVGGRSDVIDVIVIDVVSFIIFAKKNSPKFVFYTSSNVQDNHNPSSTFINIHATSK